MIWILVFCTRSVRWAFDLDLSVPPLVFRVPSLFLQATYGILRWARVSGHCLKWNQRRVSGCDLRGALREVPRIGGASERVNLYPTVTGLFLSGLVPLL